MHDHMCKLSIKKPVQRSLDVTFSVPDNLTEAGEVYGEKLAYEIFIDGLIVNLQGGTRPSLVQKEGERRLSDEEVRKIAYEAKPTLGRSSDPAKKRERTVKGLSTLPAEEQVRTIVEAFDVSEKEARQIVAGKPKQAA